MPNDTEEGRHETPSNESEDRALNRRNILLGSSALVAAAAITSGALAQAQKAAPAAPATPAAPAAPSGRKPNILVIWGDDVGVANISAYSNGVMGYETPNIDRIGRKGSSSFTTTASNPAPRAARRFSPASMASAAA
jgi:arylsulfatase